MSGSVGAGLHPSPAAPNSLSMCALDFPLCDRLREELCATGTPASVTLHSAEGAEWRCVILAGDRRFEIGFTLVDGLWARETTPGRERHLLSNDHPRVHASDEACRLSARLIAATLRDPAFPPRDPPVI